MPELNIAVAMIVSVVFAPVYAIGVCFLLGAGGILLGGYHKDPRSERGKRAGRYIVRRAGILTLIVLSSLHACILTGVLGEMTACYALIAVTAATIAIGLTLFNRDKKIRQKYSELEASESEYRASHPEEFEQ